MADNDKSQTYIRETRTPEFLAMNPAGQVPVVRFADNGPLAQSNAIILHLARGSDLIPHDPFERALMYQWMFWEQYNHEPNIATLRFWHGWIGEANWSDLQRANAPAKQAAGEAALALTDTSATAAE